MLIRIDILLSVNVLRSSIGHPKRSEMNVVTSCNYPLAHTMISGNIGANDDVDFVKNIHALSS